MSERGFSAELVARKIREWGLEAPAILALRLTRPIGPILASSLFFLEPFIGPGRIRPIAGLLNEPEEILAFLEGENDE